MEKNMQDQMSNSPEKPSWDLKSMTLEELTDFLGGLGEKKFRAKQLYEWLHVHKAVQYEDMTNLPLALRRKLESMPVVSIPFARRVVHRILRIARTS